MELEGSLDNTRWRILETLADGKRTTTEIAAAAKTSLPNVSQQARLLAAQGLIRQEREERAAPGKPRTAYALSKELAHLALVRRGFVGKKTLALDPFHAAVLNIWFCDRTEDHYYLQKFFWQNEEYIQECDAIGVIESKGDELHLLVIAAPEKLETLRKRFSKVEVSSPTAEKRKSVISWTHSLEEIRDGLSRKEEYFRNLTKKVHVILDREGTFTRVGS